MGLSCNFAETLKNGGSLQLSSLICMVDFLIALYDDAGAPLEPK